MRHEVEFSVCGLTERGVCRILHTVCNYSTYPDQQLGRDRETTTIIIRLLKETQLTHSQDKAYGRAALVEGDADTEDVLKRFRSVEEKVGDILEGASVAPSLLHGDLWIGESHACINHTTRLIFRAPPTNSRVELVLHTIFHRRIDSHTSVDAVNQPRQRCCCDMGLGWMVEAPDWPLGRPRL